ncbi:MAG: NADH-quinone oxidoreductase subunit H, partial [Gammaproteobacteria bacterium]
MSFALKLVWSLLGVAGAIAYGLIIGGVIRKVMARIQGRIGPPVY